MLTVVNTDICFLLATERSGTHLLRSFLNKMPDVTSPGEICNVGSSDIRSSDFSYLKFRAEACRNNPDFLYPTVNSQTTLLDEYLSLVKAVDRKRRLLVLDVKYSHVHNFNAFWWDMVSRPFLLDYVLKRKIKIIHLVRENVYQTAVSDIYAEKSGVWRAFRAEDLRKITISVGRDELTRKVRRLARNIALFEDWLAGLAHVRITYEELTSDTARCLNRVFEYLEITGDIPPEPGVLKTTPPYDQAIANLDEIADLLDLKLIDLSDRVGY